MKVMVVTGWEPDQSDPVTYGRVIREDNGEIRVEVLDPNHARIMNWIKKEPVWDGHALVGPDAPTWFDALPTLSGSYMNVSAE